MQNVSVRASYWLAAFYAPRSLLRSLNFELYILPSIDTNIGVWVGYDTKFDFQIT